MDYNSTNLGYNSSVTSTDKTLTQPDYLQSYTSSINNYFIVAIDFMLGMQCLTFNMFVFMYYRQKMSKIVPLMYTALSLCDMVTGAAALINCLTMALLALNEREGLLLIIPIQYFLTSLSNHVAAFYTILLASIRTLNIILPFYFMNRLAVIIALIIYPIFWIIIIIYEITYYWVPHDIYSAVFMFMYRSDAGASVISSIDQEATTGMFIFMCLGIPFLLPAIIALGCLSVQSYVLLHKMKSRSVISTTTTSQKQITLTILMLTLLYSICNGIFTIYMIGVYNLGLSVRILYGMYYTSTIGPFVNSAFNPVILLVRGSTLRTYARSKIRSLFCRKDDVVVSSSADKRGTCMSGYDFGRKNESCYREYNNQRTESVYSQATEV